MPFLAALLTAGLLLPAPSRAAASYASMDGSSAARPNLLSASRGLPFDGKAADVCNRFNNESAILECLRSAGRTPRRGGGQGGGDACRDRSFGL